MTCILFDVGTPETLSDLVLAQGKFWAITSVRLAHCPTRRKQTEGMDSVLDGNHLTIRALATGEWTRAGDITNLVNRSYVSAQTEVFLIPAPRIDETDVAALIARGEIVVAERAGTAVGVVRVHPLDAGTRYFGLLAVAPEASSRGVGRALLDAIEHDAVVAGATTMELDLLLPDPATTHQARLRRWYEGRGYRPVSSRPFADVEPEAAKRLRHPTQLIRYVRDLAPSPPLT